jgi:hypothetical protein
MAPVFENAYFRVFVREFHLATEPEPNPFHLIVTVESALDAESQHNVRDGMVRWHEMVVKQPEVVEER